MNKLKLFCVILSQTCLLVSYSQGQSINTTVRNSPSGLGAFNFDPTSNVNQFMVFGHSAAYAYFGTSISSMITGNGQLVAGAGAYTTSYPTWNNAQPGTTGGVSGSLQNIDPGTVEALGNGYSTTPWTTATVNVTAPTNNFSMDFFVHDYYAAANLTIAVNGLTISQYTNIMSSSSGRDSTFVFAENISNVNVGDILTFSFNNYVNLGSAYANINIMAASLNYTLPTSISSLPPTTLVNTTPEPSTWALIAVGGLALQAFRRRRK